MGGVRSKESTDKPTATHFRPSDVTVGPDGALYSCDWYDPRVGASAHMDETFSGTIYRIAPRGFKPDIPALDLTTIEGQVSALRSPAVNTRYLGFRGLKTQGESALPVRCGRDEQCHSYKVGLEPIVPM